MSITEPTGVGAYGKVHLRVLYDLNTHVLTVTIIQSNKVLPNEKTYNKVQFGLTLLNKEKAPKYKTTTKEYTEYMDYNESFYFPNVEKGIYRVYY
jgi:hypothetical protein